MSLLSNVNRLLGFTASAVPVAKAIAPEILDVKRAFQRQLRDKIALCFPGLSIEEQEERLLLAGGLLVLESNLAGRTQHPNAVVCGLNLRLTHERFFPAGLIDCLAGIGSTDLEAVQAGTQNYVDGVFSVVIEALSGGYEPNADFRTEGGALWHVVLGGLQVQGIWAKRQDVLNSSYFLELLKPTLLPEITPQFFHWLKLYVSRQPNGKFIGECLFDNSPWPEGEVSLRNAALQWPEEGEFAGQKQFIMFRQCPASYSTEQCTHAVRPHADDTDGDL